MKKILFKSFQKFQEHGMPRFSAAIAYYMIFCLAPLFVFVLSILAFFLNDPTNNLAFFTSLQHLFGKEAVIFLHENLQPLSLETNFWLIFGGFVFGLIGASAVFKEVKCGLDTIFEVSIPKGNFLAMMVKNLATFGTVIIIGLFLLVSLLSTMAISIVSSYFQKTVGINIHFIEMLNFAVSFVILTAFFMIIHTLVPDARIHFRLTLLGSLVTALLFTIGKTLFGIYLATIGLHSSYGAAGSILVLLLWMFYSAQIFFFGAEITAQIKNDRKLLEKIT